jgi:hypothetical protein
MHQTMRQETARTPPRLQVIGSVARSVVVTVGLLVRGRVRSPRRRVGALLTLPGGTRSVVFRETQIKGARRGPPAVLLVEFRLRLLGPSRRFLHWLFRGGMRGQHAPVRGVPRLSNEAVDGRRGYGRVSRSVRMGRRQTGRGLRVSPGQDPAAPVGEGLGSVQGDPPYSPRRVRGRPPTRRPAGWRSGLTGASGSLSLRPLGGPVPLRQHGAPTAARGGHEAAEGRQGTASWLGP